MLYAIREGFRAVGRSPGLAVLLFALNFLLAAFLAASLARTLERELAGKDAARNMLYGFDSAWWSQWSESQSGWITSFGPDLLGVGFAFKNLDLLLKGNLPAGLFLRREEGEGTAEAVPAPLSGLDSVILGLGVIYLLLQTFLAGGILGVLRGPQGSWTIRGLLHGSGFYFGRLLRVALLALLVDYVLFRLNAPFARWVDTQAREAVSERSALAWLMGRHLLLLLGIFFVHMTSSYAKIVLVVEERSSAVLALLSSLSFCVSNLIRTFGHYLAMAGLAVLLLAVWNSLDSHWVTTGYKTQIVTLALAQALVFGRIVLRLALLGGQMALYRRSVPGLVINAGGYRQGRTPQTPPPLAPE